MKEENRSLLFGKSPMTRREFLKFCAKAVVAGVAWSMMPVDLELIKGLNGKSKFKIKVKPFRLADIYRGHDLAG